jgi:hypothetical protein
MRSVRTLAVASFVVLALFAAVPANAANRVVNGDFETCDLTGWSYAPSSNGESFTSGVYNYIGIDGCSYVALDNTVITQTFEIAAGEQFVVSFDAELIPLVSDIGAFDIIDGPCDAEDGIVQDATFGRVSLEFLQALPGALPFKTLSATIVDFDTGGSFSATTAPAPALATHARVAVSACAALGGVVFDNVVVDTA